MRDAVKTGASRARTKEKAAQVVFLITSLVSLAAVACICVFIFKGAWPAISEVGLWNFLSGTAWKPNNDPQKFGIFYMIVGSLYVSGGALLLGVPVGLMAAIFMAKFCPKKLYPLLSQCVKLLAGIRNRIGKEQINASIARVGLDPKSRKHVSKYSMGMKQRLGIAQAIMEDPDILLLDEPMNGLDNAGVRDMRNLFKELRARGKTILMASHNREDIDELCDSVCEMDAGVLTKVR